QTSGVTSEQSLRLGYLASLREIPPSGIAETGGRKLHAKTQRSKAASSYVVVDQPIKLLNLRFPVRFVYESLIKAPAEEVFGFHTQPDALTKLMPPWEHARVIQQADISVVGSRTIVEVKILRLFTITWIAQHTIFEPLRAFEDIQLRGPFRRWRHR